MARSFSISRLIVSANVVILIMALPTRRAISQVLPAGSLFLQEPAAGARSAAMGGAGTALAADASALVWNPAGLVLSRQWQACGYGTISFSNIAVTLPTTLSAQKNSIDAEGMLNLNFAGIIMPVLRTDVRWTWALAVQNLAPLQERVQTRLSDATEGWRTTSRIERHGNLLAFATGFGLQLVPPFSIGVSYSFLSGRQQTDSVNTFQTLTQSSTDRFRDQNDLSGNLLRIGVRWRAAPSLTVAGCMRLSHQINLNDHRFGDPEAGLESDSLTVEFEKPMSYNIGLAWQMATNFNLGLDFYYQPWSQVVLRRAETEIRHLFANAHSLHMGGEYIRPTASFTLFWRFGFAMQPEQLFETAPNDPSRRGDQISSHRFSTGLGIEAGHVAFDLTLTYQNLQYKAPTLAEEADWADMTENNYEIFFGIRIRN